MDASNTRKENALKRAISGINDTYLVYTRDMPFKSALVSGKENALDAVIRFTFGAMPDAIDDPELFDEMIAMKNEFETDSLWIEGGSIWETEFQDGYLIVVKVQSLLN